MTSEFKSFRSDIEGLRALAVFLVVIFHANSDLIPGGFIGVDIFFVISGYLITGLLVAEFDEKRHISFSGFYARRGRRLLPAAAAVVFITLLASAFIYSPQEQSLFAKSAATASAYISNIFFALQPSDYFSADMKANPFLHTWSLAVEEQFYLFWPLFIFLGLKLVRTRKQLCILLAGLSAVSFGFCVWLIEFSQTWAFYGLPSRVWEFSLGGLARLIIVRPEVLDKWVRRALSLIAFSAVLASAFLISDEVDFPGWAAVPPVLATAILLSTGGAGSPLNTLLSNPVAQWLGQRSYGIYLWHWPILLLSDAWFIGRGPLITSVAVVVTLVFAHASYVFLENPVRRSRWFREKNLRSIGLTVSLTALSIAVAAVAFLNAAHIGKTKHHQRIEAAYHTHPAGIDGDCFVWPPESPRLETCDYGDVSSQNVIVLFGDSHSRQWFTPVAELASKHGFKLVTVLKASCSPADIRVYSNRLNREVHECAEWRQAAIDEIIALRPSIVIMGAYSRNYIENFEPLYPETESLEREWAIGLAQTIRRFSDSGIRTLYLQHTPQYSMDVPKCLGRKAVSYRATSSCDVPRERSVSAGLYAVEAELLSDMPYVKLVNWIDRFCDSEMCFAERDGEILMRDSHHVSEAFAQKFVRRFEIALELAE